ncbi:hypothetical protein MNBD_ALPHA06-1438 [hydrothermal vent metagenome]|uniref:histidine kinase n=1 Tax=hydrothermal vent metagenome TaxID=652676 RepID=A0A3B0REL9_9ZZZZ
MIFKRSIIWNMLIPIPVITVIVMAISWALIPKLVVENMRQMTETAATQTAFQFMTLRSYYTKNVAAKASQDGNLSTAMEHEGVVGVIPLPATMIKDLSELLSEEDTSLKVYSPFPFKTRKKAELDSFQQAAWAFFQNNPDQVYSASEAQGNKTVMRVAVADKMSSQGCVSCHNSHELSTKKDWKLGDVGGVLEVSTDISTYLVAAKKLENTILRGIAIFTLILLIILALITRSIIKPITAMTSAMTKLANDELDTDIPAGKRQDELGKMSGALDVFKQNLIKSKTFEADLQNQKNRAEAANKAKSTFLAMMSHELRTPMNAILGSAQILESMELNKDVREQVEMLRMGGETLTAILSDVLDLSKIESGKLDTESAAFNLHELLDQAEKLWAAPTQEKGLDLQFVISPQTPNWIKNDATRLRQIIFNLISNAIKFTEQGTIRISVQATPVEANRSKISLAISDTGIGLSKAQQQKLFTPFQQADSSITRRFGGTGLGLSISRSLARLLGGDLTVTSVVGEGSVFTLDFETELAKPVTTNEAQSKVGQILKSPLRILAAEDNALNMKVLRSFLKAFPFEIVHAENGQVAVEILAVERFDLVLMDVQMPVMDGVAATRQIRSKVGPNQNVPVIAMTANAMSGDRETYLQAGMSDYVPKPIDMRQLLSAIARAASQTQNQPQAEQSQTARS